MSKALERAGSVCIYTMMQATGLRFNQLSVWASSSQGAQGQHTTLRLFFLVVVRFTDLEIRRQNPQKTHLDFAAAF